MSACRSHDPCESAVNPFTSGIGESGLDLTALAREAPRVRETIRLRCVHVAVFSASDYGDTLAVGSAALVGSVARIRGLPEAVVDVVISRDGFFPVKIAGLTLNPGRVRLDDRLTLYPVSAPVVLQGQLVAQLRPGSSLRDIGPLYSVFDGIEVRAEPGSFHFQLKNAGRRLTQMASGRLAARLALSPHVVGVWPVGEFSSVY